MISILHVTPHLGGGVGRVLLNYLDHTFACEYERHSLVCLDYANPGAVARAAEIGIPLRDRMAGRMSELLKLVARADIVVMHWWNHPLLYALLVRETLPPARLLLWSHVSGLFPTQNFTDELIRYPDYFVVASPVSFEAPALKRLEASERDRVRLVFSCAGIAHVASAKPLAHLGFRVGYVGTVDYCKMHPHFIRMSVAADIPEAHFVVCGGPNEAAIRQEAIRAGVANRFDFLGQVSNVAAQLATFDVFGYPLAPYHYGTGEQALIEALAVGVPPVVLGNGAERHIVQDGVTGLVAEDERAYSQALEQLHRQPELRRTLSENARRTARVTFTIESLARAWSVLYKEAMKSRKRPRRWPGSCEGRPRDAEIFLASLGEYGADYAESMVHEANSAVINADARIANGSELFRSKTRGSVFHYQSFFPHDPWLNFWCGLMQLHEGNREDSDRYFNDAGKHINGARIGRYLRGSK